MILKFHCMLLYVSVEGYLKSFWICETEETSRLILVPNQHFLFPICSSPSCSTIPLSLGWVHAEFYVCEVRACEAAERGVTVVMGS